jgi:pyridoxamine 5'-phosphate oxidase
VELSDLRRDFGKLSLDENKLPSDPVELLKTWLNDALKLEIQEFNAMVLSTVDQHKKPSSRIVLLKEISNAGDLFFFTNYNSRKGLEIAKNQSVALNFFWSQLERQVRVEGVAQKASREISETYFNTRPLESRISAIISPQSRVIKKLDELRKMASEVKESDIRLPGNWGGYEIIPEYFEFWQGGSNRLHDRICFSKNNNVWIKKRLAP